MSILNYDDNGNFVDSLIAGCNGHSAGDRQVLSMKEEIEIIKPWALKIGIGYEIVELKGEDDGIRFYTLSSSVLEGKKIGLPVYAIVEDGSPRLLNFREELYSIAFSL